MSTTTKMTTPTTPSRSLLCNPDIPASFGWWKEDEDHNDSGMDRPMGSLHESHLIFPDASSVPTMTIEQFYQTDNAKACTLPPALEDVTSSRSHDSFVTAVSVASSCYSNNSFTTAVSHIDDDEPSTPPTSSTPVSRSTSISIFVSTTTTVYYECEGEFDSEVDEDEDPAARDNEEDDYLAYPSFPTPRAAQHDRSRAERCFLNCPYEVVFDHLETPHLPCVPPTGLDVNSVVFKAFMDNMLRDAEKDEDEEDEDEYAYRRLDGEVFEAYTAEDMARMEVLEARIALRT
ncbi:hypothetical protein EUX98_g322 [Antrodiella citrinella]|uniref:Uncharacterized protein n=1 Tax=Antrodiella citrinella TaxID=2447956 RepID=A0A4S4N6P2_9APHY|nr:hypothetical protein EUX98_g322 [Antrodiella citrinella]